MRHAQHIVCDQNLAVHATTGTYPYNGDFQFFSYFGSNWSCPISDNQPFIFLPSQCQTVFFAIASSISKLINFIEWLLLFWCCFSL